MSKSIDEMNRGMAATNEQVANPSDTMQQVIEAVNTLIPKAHTHDDDPDVSEQINGLQARIDALYGPAGKLRNMQAQMDGNRASLQEQVTNLSTSIDAERRALAVQRGRISRLARGTPNRGDKPGKLGRTHGAGES